MYLEMVRGPELFETGFFLPPCDLSETGYTTYELLSYQMGMPNLNGWEREDFVTDVVMVRAKTDGKLTRADLMAWMVHRGYFKDGPIPKVPPWIDRSDR